MTPSYFVSGMNNTQSVVCLHSQTALSGSGNSLREDSLISVRILKVLSPGSFLASFASGRFTVHSELPLREGIFFQAKVHIENGKLMLLPQDRNTAVFTIPSSGTDLQNGALFSYLSSLGLGGDIHSKKILQFLMQDGFSINRKMLQRIYRAASRFSGKEVLAGQLALAMEEKGISCDSPLLEYLLDFLDEGENPSESHEKKFSGYFSHIDSENYAFVRQIKEELKNFFDDLLSGDYDHAPSDDGRLAFFNQYLDSKQKTEKKTWIIVPFEFSVKGNPGTGFMKVFLDTGAGVTEKMVIDFKINGKKMFFLLNFIGKKCKKILFNMEGINVDQHESMTAMMRSFYNDQSIEIEYVADLDSAFGVQDLPVKTVRGFA